MRAASMFGRPLDGCSEIRDTNSWTNSLGYTPHSSARNASRLLTNPSAIGVRWRGRRRPPMRPDVPHINLVTAILLGAVLLFGRTALALHPYDHDVVAPEPECELCEHAHVSNDGCEAGAVFTPATIIADITASAVAPAVYAPHRRIHLPRAPPRLFV